MSSSCPICGSALPADAPKGICPKCLLGAGLTPPPDEPERGSPEPQHAASFEPGGKLEGPSFPQAAAGGDTRAPGHRHFGDYELLSEIAQGGMGIVYRARQLSLNRIVAIKMLLYGRFTNPRLVERFRAEARAAAALRHPHIVAIHEVGEHDGQPYFSMDYVPGKNLADLVRDQPLPARRAAAYLKTIAQAVHYAHQNNILHRDLKPSNILIDQEDQPRVTDFGLAKRVESLSELRVESGAAETNPSDSQLSNFNSQLTATGQMLGSPNYMPPEQVEGMRHPPSPASDVYALGAILYHLLTGRPPFLAESLQGTLLQVTQNDPPSPRLLQPTVPRDLETICLKCLEKEPGRRYPTADDLANELDSFLRGEPIQARAISAGERLWRWCRRKPALAASFLLILFLLLIVIIGSPLAAYRIQRESNHAQAAALAATNQLRAALLDQARANRWSGRAGRRYDSLKIIAKAATMNPPPEMREQLRDEAIACFALTDVRVAKTWPTPGGSIDGALRFDSKLELYARPAERGNITVRRVSDDREMALLPGFGSRVVWMGGFSQDTRFLIVSYQNQTNAVWNITQREIALMMPARCVHEFTPDNRSLVSSHPDGSLTVHSMDTWQEVQRLPLRSRFDYFNLNPDGSRLAGVLSDRDRVQIVELASGKVQQTLALGPRLKSVAFSPDGQTLAAGTESGRIQLRDLSTGDTRLSLDAHERQVSHLGFNHAGDLLASVGWDGRLRFWDVISGRLLIDYPGSGYQTQFSDNDRYFAAATANLSFSLLEVAAPSGFRLLTHGKKETQAWVPAFSPDGELLATTDGEGAHVWDLVAGRELASLPVSDCRSIHFQPDGLGLITSGQPGLFRWAMSRISDGQSNTLFIDAKQRLHPGVDFAGSALSANGRYLVVAHRPTAAALVFDLENPATFATLRPHYNCQHVAITPDGRFVATGTWNGSGVKVWDVATRKVIKDLPAVNHAFVVFSPDGRWLATSAEADRLYEVGSWQLRFTFPREGSLQSINQLALSPDGTMLAICISPEKFQLYATSTGQRLGALEPPKPSALANICFSPDSATLAVLQANHAVQLWDLSRIRQQLAGMNLDWDLPPYPPPNASANTNSPRLKIELK